MTTEHRETRKTESRRILKLLPWIIAAGVLAVYVLTLNRWISPANLHVVARVGDLDWRPILTAPLHFLVTLPLRLLPAAWTPLLLNLMTAVFGALTLALLARTISLLPYDRTREQRQRLQETTRLPRHFAWIPPLGAALALAFQRTFWEHSISATGEMLNLLVFAYCVRCLLEFRSSHKDSWLFKLAFVYGLGVTNNWAMIGFFPFFFIGIVWMKRLRFFEFTFLSRATGLGLLGLSLYLLLPVVAVFSGGSDVSFWAALKSNLGEQKMYLTLPKTLPALRGHLALISLTSVLPVLLIVIRWPTFQGDISAAAGKITGWMFHVLHLTFFAAIIAVLFDPKFSPRELGFGLMPFLTFYYLSALALGYMTGYLLLVFGVDPVKSWERSKGPFRMLSRVVAGLACVALAAVPVAVAYQNLPPIRLTNHPGLDELTRAMAEAVPDTGAVILSDDPQQLMLLEAAFIRLGKKRQNLLLETASLPYPSYHRRLAHRRPDFSEFLFTDKEERRLGDVELIVLIDKLRNEYPVYYLHPSFGYYFERFYLRPEGVVYAVHPYPSGTLNAPPLSPEEIERNENFWARQESVLASFSARARKEPAVQWVALLYSRALNYWGVELQRLGHLDPAARRFEQALDLNPENVVASLNQQFNTNLRSGTTATVQPDVPPEKKLGVFRAIDTAMSMNGPYDEAGFCLLIGQVYARGNNLRQAAHLFQRVLELQPDNIAAQLSMAKTYLDFQPAFRDPDKTLELLEKVRRTPSAQPPSEYELLHLESLAYMAKGDADRAEEVLRAALQKTPQDEAKIAMLIQFYAISGKPAAALHMVEEQLQSKPDNIKALVNKAILLAQQKEYEAAHLVLDDILKQTPLDESVLLYKANLLFAAGEFARSLEPVEKVLIINPKNVAALVQKGATHIHLKDFKEAISSLDKALKLQPHHHAALLNRAIANLQSDNFKAARRDYDTLLRISPVPIYSAYYGLGEIAARDGNSAAALTNYELYLKYAPRDTPEYTQVTEKVETLKSTAMK